MFFCLKHTPQQTHKHTLELHSRTHKNIKQWDATHEKVAMQNHNQPTKEPASQPSKNQPGKQATNQASHPATN